MPDYRTGPGSGADSNGHPLGRFQVGLTARSQPDPVTDGGSGGARHRGCLRRSFTDGGYAEPSPPAPTPGRTRGRVRRPAPEGGYGEPSPTAGTASRHRRRVRRAVTDGGYGEPSPTAGTASRH